MIKVQIIINYQNKENMSEVLNQFERSNCNALKQKRPSGQIRWYLFASLTCRLIETIVRMLEHL